MPNDILKKAFILFMRINKVDEYVVLNNSTYVNISGVAGCFKRGEQYVVYSINENGEKEQITVPNELEAYCNLASKFNLDFYEWLKNNYREELGMKGLHM